jgi:radical SAM superfamily enzyme YgiQ (UPF0313 family)
MPTRVRDLKGAPFESNFVSASRYGLIRDAVVSPSHRRYQRILLISPQATLFRGDLPRCTYPLGLSYIAAVLEANDYEVRILDCLAEGYYREASVDHGQEFITYGLGFDEVATEIRTFAPNVIGVSSIFSNQADLVAQLFETARGVCPEAKLVTGGAHARYFPNNYIEDIGVDAVFLGEAEATFLQYLDVMNGAGNITDVPNIMAREGNQTYRDDTFVLIKRKQRDLNGHWAEIDDIPFPAWHLLNMEKYFSIGAYQSPYTIGTRVGQVYTSRGCSAKCTFCTTTNFWGGKLRRRSPANVVAELECLKSDYQINEYHIQDDNITNDTTHAKELFRALKTVNLPWCTPQGTALWRMDEELLDLMASSGCYQVSFAIESGVQRVLTDLIQKPLNLQKTKHLIGYARRLGISVHGFFIIGMPPMFGFPGETIDEMHRTFDFAQECEFDSASFFTATPIVGSALLQECMRQKFIEPNTPLYRMSYKQPRQWNLWVTGGVQ